MVLGKTFIPALKSLLEIGEGTKLAVQGSPPLFHKPKQVITLP